MEGEWAKLLDERGVEVGGGGPASGERFAVGRVGGLGGEDDVGGRIGAIGSGHGILPEEHGGFLAGEVGVLRRFPEARRFEEGVGLFPEGDGLSGVGVVGEIELFLEGGVVERVEAVAEDAMLIGEDAGGESGLHGGGDGGERGGEGGLAFEGIEEAEILGFGFVKEGLVEAGDENKADAGHGWDSE